jgi:hypothetical protein
MMSRTICSFLGALAGVLLMTSGLAQDRSAKLGPDERAECLARAGRIMIAGLSGNEICALPLADAGKRCTSGDQCIGDCLLDDSKLRGVRHRATRLVGRCQATDYGFGCRTKIERGRIQHSLCID